MSACVGGGDWCSCCYYTLSVNRFKLRRTCNSSTGVLLCFSLSFLILFEQCFFCFTEINLQSLSSNHMCLVLSRLIIHQNTVSSSIANERRNKSKGFSSSYHHFNVSTPSSAHIFLPFHLLVHRTSSENIRREFNLIKRKAIIIDFLIFSPIQ